MPSKLGRSGRGDEGCRTLGGEGRARQGVSVDDLRRITAGGLLDAIENLGDLGLDLGVATGGVVGGQPQDADGRGSGKVAGVGLVVEGDGVPGLGGLRLVDVLGQEARVRAEAAS
jgi:hypothetical protein